MTTTMWTTITPTLSRQFAVRSTQCAGRVDRSPQYTVCSKIFLMVSYKDLKVWQKSMELVLAIYKATKDFPAEEKFGLISQMCRSAVSIPSNIAEGYGRGNKKENHQFVNIAYGSALELDTQLIICKELGLIKADWDKIESILEEVRKMLYSYRNSLNI